MIFEGDGPGRCNCNFAKNYPYAFGPRLGVGVPDHAEKTVLRAGWGIVYSGTGDSNGATQGGLTAPAAVNSPAFGRPVMTLQSGIPFAAARFRISIRAVSAGRLRDHASPSGLVRPERRTARAADAVERWHSARARARTSRSKPPMSPIGACGGTRRVDRCERADDRRPLPRRPGYQQRRRPEPAEIPSEFTLAAQAVSTSRPMRASR